MHRFAKTSAISLCFWISCAPVSAQVFMSERDALKIIAPQSAWKEEVKTLEESARQTLAESTRLRFTEPSYRFQVAREGDRTTAYALTLDEIGKTEPITFTVGLDASGKVKDVILLVFRESRGAEVRDPRFLKQFRGKTHRDKVRIYRDILNYAGATLSSQALARGVRKTLALYEYFYAAGGKAALVGDVILAELKDLGRPRAKRDTSPPPRMARRDPQHYIQARYLMGTVCAIEVYAGDLEEAEHAANSAFTAMQEVDRKMSNYREESELSQLNQRAGSGPVEVSDELFQVLSFAQRVSEASDGTFDMTVGPLLRAWGFLPANSAPATSPSGHPVVGYRHVLLSSSDRTVQYAVAGIEIDLGGIAKGYAVDRAVDALRAAEVKNARVSAGGSTIFALGAPPENALGWPHTLPSGKVIILRDQAASTSGHSEKFVESGGRRHSHIFDPRRGEPVSTEIRSVTVEAATAMESDALTKPFFILDPGGQARLREAFPGLRVRISRNTPKESAAVQ